MACSSLLDTVKTSLTPYLSASRWLIAYSGGVDSHVLLQLLMQWRDSDSTLPPLIALHINHQLHPDSSQWAEHCQQQAQQLGVDFICCDVDIDATAGSLEDSARKARYQAFEAELGEGELLLLGHHQDDQVETFLLRLLRGSGVTGAAAMPQSRSLGKGFLSRPLLNHQRSKLLAYAEQQQLHWVDDPSNTDNRFDRNFLRNTLLPEVAQRWPDYQQTLSRAAALNRQASELNTELAELDFSLCSSDVQHSSLRIDELLDLSLARQKNLLRYWMDQRGFALPSAAQLEAIINEVILAKDDAEPLVHWAGFEARRFKGQLFVMQKLVEFDVNARYECLLDQPLLMAGAGQLTIQLSGGEGVESFTIQFRQGGERCTPLGRSGSQTLKKLFQEYNIPPWLRDRVPLIYAGEELVAVGDYWVCESAVASAGPKIHWQQQMHSL